LLKRVGRSIGNIRSDWIEIGGLGRLAVAGIVLAMALTLVLGFSITRSARGHLLDARAAMVVAIVEDLPPFSVGEASPAAKAQFDVAVRVKVLGGETVRVKVWAPDGEIVYSDLDALVGTRFELPQEASDALQIGVEVGISDLSDPAHSTVRDEGELIEVFVALPTDVSSVVYAIEVEQDATGLTRALSLITRNVWVSIGVGLIAIGLVMAFGVAARTREVNRRRRQAEMLLVSSFRAQEEERSRVVKALHDDIGQPMYRLLYGLEGSKAKLSEDDPISVELGTLASLVREMDATLRNELRHMHFELAADAGLAAALGELADLTRTEADLDVCLEIDLDREPSRVSRTEIYRAAREALTNVRKHASADRVDVHLYQENGRLTLDVTDNGSGLTDVSDPGLGLSTTRQRFAALDGDVTLEPGPTGGMRLRAWLPSIENDEEETRL